MIRLIRSQFSWKLKKSSFGTTDRKLNLMETEEKLKVTDRNLLFMGEINKSYGMTDRKLYFIYCILIISYLKLAFALWLILCHW